MTSLRTDDRRTQPAEPHPANLLRTGDRLDADTFIRLYEQTSEGFRAELIGGIVYVASPISADHGKPNHYVNFWLGAYELRTPGVQPYSATTVRLGPANHPEPDASLIIRPECGGQATIEAGYIVGAPELIVEVAYSTWSTDLTDKLAVYEQAGVREYVVILPQEAKARWFVHREGQFHPNPTGDDGLFRSTVFPGLWLDPSALTAGEVGRVFEAVQRGTNTPEHAEFVARLTAYRRGTLP